MSKFTMQLVLAAALGGASALSGAASLTYNGAASFITYTDPNCSTSFTMDSTGAVTCAGTGTPPAAVVPVCTVSATPSLSITEGSSVTLTAACQNSPTSWAWSQGATPVGTSSPSYATPTTLTAGSYTYNLSATNTAGTGVAQATITVAAAGTATPPPSGCSTTATANEAWSWAAAAGTTTSKVERMATNQTLAVAFTTGPTLSLGSFQTAEVPGTISADRYATVSTCPGDFSVSTPNCYVDGNAQGSNIAFSVGFTRFGNCALQPNTTYYYNTMHANPANTAIIGGSFVQTCPAGASCAFYLQFMHTN